MLKSEKDLLDECEKWLDEMGDITCETWDAEQQHMVMKANPKDVILLKQFVERMIRKYAPASGEKREPVVVGGYRYE